MALHGCISFTIEGQFPEIAETRPELLATTTPWRDL
jgi:hypothetical protein